MRNVTTIMALLLAASPAVARRDLPVPPDKGWQHAASGIILTAKLAGLPRTMLSDAGDDERDVAAEFATPDKATIATIYIFRPGLMSVPMWFDRAQTALELKDVYGGVRAAAKMPVAFAPPGGVAPSGLRQTYTPTRGPYRATALAIAPVGEWLVAVRLSSRMLDPVTIDPELTDILTAIRWPANTGAVPVARPIVDCADSLAYHKAKLVQPDMMQALLGSLTAAAGTASPGESGTWCREAMKPKALYGVYRLAGSSDGYTLAIGDSGRAASVYKAFSLPDQPSTGGYAVSFRDLDGSIASYPSFDKLPQPDQVAALILRGRATARTTTAGGKNTVTIGVPSK